jgi:hypothetical protein
MKREKWVVVRDTTGGGNRIFIIGFEGSQALPVCPSGKRKLLTGTIEVFFCVGGLTGCVRRTILKLPLGGLHVKHTKQRGIRVPTQHLLLDQGNPRKTGLRTFHYILSTLHDTHLVGDIAPNISSIVVYNRCSGDCIHISKIFHKPLFLKIRETDQSIFFYAEYA